MDLLGQVPIEASLQGKPIVLCLKMITSCKTLSGPFTVYMVGGGAPHHNVLATQCKVGPPPPPRLF